MTDQVIRDLISYYEWFNKPSLTIMAQEIGISQQLLSLYVYQARNPRIENVNKIKDYLTKKGWYIIKIEGEIKHVQKTIRTQ
jgi:hypothetical protein